MKLGLGTVQFGLDYGISNAQGKSSTEEVCRILDCAAQHDITMLDSAPAYGDSEAVLGDSLVDNEIFNIVTKTPHFSTTNIEQELLTSFAKSLTDLRVNSVYGLLVHRADNLLSAQGNALWDAMQELKQLSKVKKIGVSVYTVEQMEKILASYNVDIVQLPINVFNQEFLVSGMLSELKKMNIEVHARSVFLQGLLLMNKLPKFLSRYTDIFDYYNDKLTEFELSKQAAALGFVKHISSLDVILLGVANEMELKQDIQIYNEMNIDIRDFYQFACNDELLINPAKWKI